jgi:hypothetical protein
MSEMNNPSSGARPWLAKAVVVSVIVLCVVACAITFLLPADSLVVDLVYQGF